MHKTLAIVGIGIALISFVLFALRSISTLTFWMSIALAGIILLYIKYTSKKVPNPPV